LALAPQFSLNPHHRKKATSRRTRPVHETSSDKCKRCGIIIHGSSNALHLSACGSSQDQHLGRAGTWHRCPATAVADCISFDPEKVMWLILLAQGAKKASMDYLLVERCSRDIYQVCVPNLSSLKNDPSISYHWSIRTILVRFMLIHFN
jgi:hypothetical protein